MGDKLKITVLLLVGAIVSAGAILDRAPKLDGAAFLFVAVNVAPYVVMFPVSLVVFRKLGLRWSILGAALLVSSASLLMYWLYFSGDAQAGLIVISLPVLQLLAIAIWLVLVWAISLVKPRSFSVT